MPRREIVIKHGTAKGKKYTALVYEKPPGGGELEKRKTVHFGQVGYPDYTMHRSETRKASYLARHGASEDWSRTGMTTPGFLAKNILWNKPSIKESVADLNKKYRDTKFVVAPSAVAPPPPEPKPKPPKPRPKPIVAKTGPVIAASDLPPALARLGPLQLPPMPRRFAPVLTRKTPYRDTKYGPPK